MKNHMESLPDRLEMMSSASNVLLGQDSILFPDEDTILLVKSDIFQRQEDDKVHKRSGKGKG